MIELSGRPFSATLPEYESVYPVIQMGVAMPRPDLDQRIADRVHRMWQLGLVDEVRQLELAGLRDGRTASRALGYAQVLKFLAGDWTEDEAAAQTIQATRRFVRRQESWFRRDPRVQWIPAGADLLERALAIVRIAADGRVDLVPHETARDQLRHRPLGGRTNPGQLASTHAVCQGPWDGQRLCDLA